MSSTSLESGAREPADLTLGVEPEVGGPAGEDDGLLRMHVAFQRGRALVYLGLYAAAMVGNATGAFRTEPRGAHALLVTSLLSVVVFTWLYRRRVDRRLGIRIEPGWIVCDVVFITYLLHLVGDPWGLWLIWYLTNTAAAAFVVGGRAAAAVAGANALAYLTLLAVTGELQDGGDVARATGRLLLLYGPSLLFLRGIADLRAKRLRIRELLDERGQQVEELERLTAALGRRGRELADATARSEEASRAKSQFLANMSHELRTPMNSIIGFAEILVDRVGPELETRYARFLENILKSGKHLLTLINDVLDLSKIEAGKMELQREPVALGDLVEGVRRVMLGFVGDRGIELRVDVPADLPTLTADGPKLKQVLYNLVSNAVKFSPDGTTVEVAARTLDAATSPLGVASVALAVRDEGIGIAAEDLERIFDEFHQLDGGTTRAHGGTGLGLTLVRRLVAMHGGTVTVDSTVGAGSTFTVVLPRDPAATPPDTAADGDGAPRARPGAPVVLVVEDDEPFYRALAADLAAAGYRPRRASRGEEALAIVRDTPPAAITLDLALPGLDGWEVLKELKSDPGTADVPVIIVTLSGDHELGFALGAEDVLLKPLDRQRFFHRLEQLLAPDDATPPRPVLLVDDDPDAHELLADVLAGSRWELLSAYDGATGLDLARTERPSLVVLDLMMPRMNGFEVAASLGADPRTAAIPILVLTAKEVTADDRRRLGGKILALLSKAPFDRREILDTMAALEARRGTRADGDG